MDNPVGAIRYAIRQFRLSPVFTASAVLTLSLGIGGTTAIFTLIHAVMLRSLPVADPETPLSRRRRRQLLRPGRTAGSLGMFSYPLFERIKAETPEFEQLTAFQAGGFRVSVRRPGVDVAARSLRSEYVTGNYFTTFGIGAFGGRVFTAEDDTPASPPVVVLSHHSWEATYGGDQSLVGQTLVIEGHPFTVAGVAPPGFFGDTLRNNPPDLWIPLQHEPMVTGANSLLRQPISAWLRVIGRLKPGATTDGIAPRLTNVLRQWIPRDAGWPANWLSDVEHLLPKQTIAIVPAGAGVGVMKEQYASSLQLLMAVCGLVLLIACANVANLLLARSVARRTQTAVRMAIGASRSQIVTQALVESILLAIGGGIVGLVVAMGAARLLLSLAFSVSTFLPISTRPSPLVLAFAFGVALITGVLFGAVPAWLATRTDPIDALRGSGRSTGDHSSFTRTALLVLQATLSVVLVAGATMLGRSLNNVQHQDSGSPSRSRPRRDQPSLRELHRAAADGDVPRPGRPAESHPRRAVGEPRALQPADRQLGRDGDGRRPSAAEARRQRRRVVGSRERALPAEPRHDDGARAHVRGGGQRNDGAGRDRQRGVRQALLQERRGSDRPAFGLDEPQNVGTFTIVGVVRDARWQSFQFRRRRGRCSTSRSRRM